LTRFRVLGLSVLLSLVASSCLGDPGYVVYIFNRTSQTIVVTVEGSSDDPSRPREIAPGSSVSMTWLYPRSSLDSRRATVRARTGDGQLVFCRKYSYDEVKADLRWEVIVTADTLSCS
jgi:hypothetical protein